MQPQSIKHRHTHASLTTGKNEWNAEASPSACMQVRGVFPADLSLYSSKLNLASHPPKSANKKKPCPWHRCKCRLGSVARHSSRATHAAAASLAATARVQCVLRADPRAGSSNAHIRSPCCARHPGRKSPSALWTATESVIDRSMTHFRSISELQRRLERLEGSPVPQASGLVTNTSPLYGPEASETTPVPIGGTGVVRGIDYTGGSKRSPRPTENAPANLTQSDGASHQNEDETIYGPSSNISFIRQVTLAADTNKATGPNPGETRDKAENSTPTVLGFSTTESKSPDALSEPLMLPERWLADNLVNVFWEFVHPVFPILHRSSFVASYEALWQPTRGSGQKRDFKDVVFHATLSIVLALGAQRTEQVSVAEQLQLADKFYRQSVKFVSVDTLDHSSLQVVQLLLLRGVYLHYTQYADRCWNTVGVALRVAQGLGLHAQGDKSNADNQLQREMRRRVWHCCLTMDRYD